MRPYLEEAARLASETARTGCPVSDTAAFMDSHPECRLVLEDTYADPFGRVYRDVPADTQSRWPSHLARTLTTFLKIGHSPAKVFALLDVLHRLDADERVVRMAIAGARRHESLDQAIAYFSTLADQLDTVSSDPPEEELTLADAEPRCRPRVRGTDTVTGSWMMPAITVDEHDLTHGQPGAYRAELIHEPCSGAGEETPWLRRQPAPFQRLYNSIQRATADRLPWFKEYLLGPAKIRWTHDQISVLWTAFRSRRDAVQREDQRAAARHLGATALKLVSRIRRARTAAELRWVGVNLYRSMRGEVSLPGLVSEAEWAVVFARYRARRGELPERAVTAAPSSNPALGSAAQPPGALRSSR